MFSRAGFGLFLFTIINQPVSVAQTKYYVATSGDDANTGQSPGTPFQSIAKVNSLPLQPGDSVLFRRGDTFRGTLQVSRSGSATRPIVFAAYGQGNKPVLTGSVPLTNWTSVAGNVWRTSCPDCQSQVTGVYRNGVSLPLGRYPNPDAPNKGNLNIYAHVERYQIVSLQNLPAGIDWKGAEVVMRPAPWIIERAVVDAQYGNALNLFNYSTYFPKDGSEFFFQSHPATLDQEGEWYYNATDKTFQLYSTRTNPNTQLLTATTLGRIVSLNNVTNVSFRDLYITQSLTTSFYADNVSNLTLANVDMINAGEDGLVVTGSGNGVLVENCRIDGVNNNGVLIGAYQNVTFRKNELRHVGIGVGRGRSGDGQYNGLQSFANQNVLIEHNVIDSIGYNGITFGNNTLIRQNVLSNYCVTKVDGGGIYAWNGNRRLFENIRIVSNLIFVAPDAYEKAPYQAYSIGIMLDDCVGNVEIMDNTIFNNTQWGIFLHGASPKKVTGNTLFNNRACQLVMYHNGGNCPIRGSIVKQNKFVSKLASQLVAQYESNANDLLQYGAIDSNYYARPFDERATIRGVINSVQGGNYELRDWQNFSGGQDRNSKSSPLTYEQYQNYGVGAGGVPRINSTFDTNADDWGVLYSRYGNAEAALDNANRLDGGSLRVSFPQPSGQPGSYAQITKNFGALTKGKTYLLRFDAVATVPTNLLIYLRDPGPPFQEYDRRYAITVGPTRQSYEMPFTALDNAGSAVLMFQIDGEGPTFWLDNIRLQEGAALRTDPDETIRLFYNPTLKDSLVTLNGSYRDLDNQLRTGSVLLKPFTSIVLLRDKPTLAPADLSLALQTDKRILQANEPVRLRLRIQNQGDAPAGLTRWICRLPTYLQFVPEPGQPYNDNVLSGTVQRLPARQDTTVSFRVRPTVAGQYRVAAQLLAVASPDPDSNPNSGTADGEDDAAVVDLRVDGPGNALFESPNPNPRSLPPVASNQPRADSTKADLSLNLFLSRRTPRINELVTCTVRVTNAGGASASAVQLQNQLPQGLQFVGGAGWSASGNLLTTTVASVAPGATVDVTFQARVVSAGRWVNQCQISSAPADPDSTPGNGFNTGEDDQAQADIRVE